MNPFELEPECEVCGSENLDIETYEYVCLDCGNEGLTPEGHESVRADQIYDYERDE